MNNILITIKKELRSIFRDKKTVIGMFIYPILIPCMVMLYGSIGDSVDNEDTSTTIGVNYSLSAPEKELLKTMKIEYISYESEKEMNDAYKNKKITGYLTKEDETKFIMHVDESSTDGMTTAGTIQEYLESYNNYLTTEYLINKGIDVEEAFQQISYDVESLDRNNYMVTVLLAVSLTYTILSICISSSNVAISTTATEKENGTLETLLTFPIKKSELITGKYASSVIVGFISAIISLVLMIVAFYFGSKNYIIFKDITLNINVLSILGCVLVSLLASLFISGIAMILTASAKSYKEAQSKIGLINMLGIIPMFVSILNVKITNVYYLIPICNYEQILNDLLISKTNSLGILICVASTLVYSIFIVKLIIASYNGEKILYNN
jgi:sodium transport system permease protein